METGIESIARERKRQIIKKHFTPLHDDDHDEFELTLAAMSYAAAVAAPDEEGDDEGKQRPCHDWPWDDEDFKPSEDPIRNLVKAGALIAAEIDRLQRLKEVIGRLGQRRLD